MFVIVLAMLAVVLYFVLPKQAGEGDARRWMDYQQRINNMVTNKGMSRGEAYQVLVTEEEARKTRQAIMQAAQRRYGYPSYGHHYSQQHHEPFRSRPRPQPRPRSSHNNPQNE